MNIFNTIAEYVILPVSDLVTGNSVSSKLRFLQKSQWWSEEQLIDYQNKRLNSIIKYAYSSVPYYTDLFDSLKIKPKDILNINDLEKLPLLNKEIIRKEGIERFASKTFSHRNRLQKSSSGSTGEPLFYYTTKDAYSMSLAASLRGWYWMGFRLGDKYIKLSQNPRKSKIKRIQDYFSNNRYLATNPLNESNFEYILRAIEEYKPKIIRCYPDPLLFLSKYKFNKTQFTWKPQAITTTGNTLYPETRKEIEDSFGCKIFDAYSCEGNSTVFECPSHTGYHSAMEYGISEVMDENGNRITDGIGRLITTDLWNLAHPFIRYDTQDLVEVSSSPCNCGRKLLLINRIIGRDNDILETSTGKKYIVHNFTGFFQTDYNELKKSVHQFQVIKKKNNQILFRLVVNNNFDDSAFQFIQDYWTKEFNCPVYIEIVEKIPLTKSGKRRFIMNEEELL